MPRRLYGSGDKVWKAFCNKLLRLFLCAWRAGREACGHAVALYLLCFHAIIVGG
jgi:hypothetical protein